MNDRNVLKERISRCDDDPAIWAIIEGYLNGEYNQPSMYEKIVLHFGGPQEWNKKCADTLAWEVADWESNQ